MMARDRLAPSPPKRSVLMICYAYPPIAASGVVRSVAFAERLPALGWQPRVLTVKNAKDRNVVTGESVPASIPVVRTTEVDLDGVLEFLQGAINRLFGLFGGELPDKYVKELFAIPDTQIAWFSTWPGVRLARAADVIYVSCSPFSSAVSGCLIKKLTGRPLVLDFRDAWSLNPHNRHLPIHQKAIERLERFAVRCCDRLVLNTEGARRVYRSKYPEHAHKMTAIPNGYDSLNLASADEVSRDPFRIVHVGSFYGSRSPDLLLDAIGALANDNIELVQIGAGHPSFARAAGRVRIRLIEHVPHPKALELMRSASLLYLKQGFEPGVTDYVAVAAKTYEYLATGLPILADCPPGDNADIVRQYAARSYVVTVPDRSMLERVLREAYGERLGMEPRITPEFKEAFDRDVLVRRLADVFDELSPPSRME